MTESEWIVQLKALLGSPLISQRKAGIDMGRERLANGQERELVRALLEEVADHDPLVIVQELAQAALAEDDARHSTASPAYVFGATCPKGHVSYYDRRKVCPKSEELVWRVVLRGGQDVNQVRLRCKTCGEEFFVEVDCEGYR